MMKKTKCKKSTIYFIGKYTIYEDKLLQQHPNDTSKLIRIVSQVEDWTWDVNLRTNFGSGIPDDVENFQTFHRY